MNTTLTTTSEERADMERHDVVRTAGDLLWRRDLGGIAKDTVVQHVVQMMLASCIKQERWSR